MITAAQTEIMGADPRNAVLPAAEPPEPYEPWSAPVMIHAGMTPDGTPWLWLAARCGWFLGYASQIDPDYLAMAAKSHRDSCAECGEPS